MYLVDKAVSTIKGDVSRTVSGNEVDPGATLERYRLDKTLHQARSDAFPAGACRQIDVQMRRKPLVLVGEQRDVFRQPRQVGMVRRITNTADIPEDCRRWTRVWLIGDEYERRGVFQVPSKVFVFVPFGLDIGFELGLVGGFPEYCAETGEIPRYRRANRYLRVSDIVQPAVHD